MQLQRSGRGTKADINVTPLIDVVLVMLIIFMVAAPRLMKHQTARVPPKASAPAGPSPAPLIVKYGADRKILVNDEGVTWEAFEAEIAERLRSRVDRVVFFQPETDASYGEVVRLMDLSRGAGATVTAIDTGAHE